MVIKNLVGFMNKKIKSLVKLSNKIGKFNYEDGLMYYLSIVKRIPPYDQVSYQRRFIPRINKFLSMTIGRKVFNEDVKAIDISRIKGIESMNKIQDTMGFINNYIYKESVLTLIGSHLSNGHKFSYKVAMSYMVKMSMNVRMNEVTDVKFEDKDKVLRDLMIRDEEIFRRWLSIIPEDIYPITNRSMDIRIDDKYIKETNKDYMYTYQKDERSYVLDSFSHSIGDSYDGIEIERSCRSILYKWIFTRYDTIKDFIESNPF